jgi:hypothetical protein
MGTAEKPQAGGMKRRSSDPSSSFSAISKRLKFKGNTPIVPRPLHHE